MIEVEKRFILQAGERSRLLKGAEPVSEHEINDVYFDNKDFFLTKQDKWLRNRNGEFELKVRIHKEPQHKRLVDRFNEITDEEAIRRELVLPPGKTLADDLEARGFVPFATITTIRKKYKKGDFVIDVDSVVETGYDVGEVELLVDTEEESEDAMKRILAFAEEHGLNIEPVRGKITEFIKRNRPEHWQALIDAGII